MSKVFRTPSATTLERVADVPSGIASDQSRIGASRLLDEYELAAWLSGGFKGDRFPLFAWERRRFGTEAVMSRLGWHRGSEPAPPTM
jgi:hypothetical protein